MGFSLMKNQDFLKGRRIPETRDRDTTTTDVVLQKIISQNNKHGGRELNKSLYLIVGKKNFSCVFNFF